MKRLPNLIDIRINNHSLYEALIKYDCAIYENHKCIYEGKYDKNVGMKITNTDKAMIIFELPDKYAMMTLSENKALNEVLDIFECNAYNYNVVMNNPKLYNRIMNLSIDLPQMPSIIEGNNIERLYKFIIEADNDVSDDAPDDNTDETPEDDTNNEEIPGDGLKGDKEKEEEEKKDIKANIKFTIWEEPDKKVQKLKSNTAYQKIEYLYSDKKAGLTVDFLLGFKDNTWQIWMGKPGAVSYDDDPWKDTKEKDFDDGLLKSLDLVYDVLKEIIDEPDEWPQFYINI